MSVGSTTDINVSERLIKRLAEYDKSVETLKKLPSDVKIQLVEIRPNEKTPHGSDSWKSRTFSFEYGRELVSKKNYNIAIVARLDGICIMDIDLTAGKFSIPKEIVSELVEKYNTFTVMTKSGGLQLYFINGGLTRHFAEKGFAENPKLMYQGKDSGEIRTHNQYVLFPGSFVPKDYDKKGWTKEATGMYTVIRNVPLKKMTPDDLPKWFVIEQDKQKSYKREKIKSYINVNKITTVGITEKMINEVGMTLEEVRSKDKELNDLLSGADHIGDRKSRSEADFRTCIRLDFWRFDDNQRASILQRYRPYDKVFRLDYLLQTVEKARSNEKYNPDYTKILENQITKIKKVDADELPVEIPIAHRWTLLKAPPRLGKTHRAMEWLAKNGGGVYCTNRHEIISHAIEIFRKYIGSGKTAVYLAGKDKCCNRDGGVNCENCPKAPHTFVAAGDTETLSVSKAILDSLTLLHKEQILTPDLLMDNKDVCPYFTLMLAETEADYCFTIPFFLMNKDHVRGVKKQRDLLIIDEDPVCATFYPQGYELMSYSYVGKKSFICNNELGDKIKICDAIDKMISDKKRKPWWDKELVRMTSIINLMNDSINKFIDNPNSERAEELLVEFGKIDISNQYTFEEKGILKKKLAEYEREIDGLHDTTIYDIFAPLIHVGKMPFVWIGNHPKTLQFVANREVLYIPEEYYKHCIIIGATESEMYIRDACGKDYENESEIVEINNFKYSKNFILIRLASDKKKTETRMMYTLMNIIAHENARNNKIGDPTVPFLVLESSKMKQESLQKHMKSQCIISTNDSEIDQFFNWTTGKANIFYSNSTLSRGLDVPFYDVIFADSLNFSVPYWSAMREYYKLEGNTVGVFECNTIITKIISDEVTNSVLRCSPTKDTEFDPINSPGELSTKEMDAKIIVIRESDVTKILPTVRTQMHDHMVAVASEDASTKMNPKLESVAQVIRRIAKKVSRHEQIKNRDRNANLQIKPYCEQVLRQFLKNKVSDSALKGVYFKDISPIMESDKYLSSNLEALNLVDTGIRDYILADPNIKCGWKRSEKALFGLISGVSRFCAKKAPIDVSTSRRRKEEDDKTSKLVLTKPSGFILGEEGFQRNRDQSGGLAPDVRKIGGNGKVSRKKIAATLEGMVKAGLLRSEYDGVQRYYRLPDKSLYGDPPKNAKASNTSDADW
jgi:hypothetical protein